MVTCRRWICIYCRALLRNFQGRRRTTPSVKVVLHDLSSDELCNELRNGMLHLALMMQPSEELIAGIEFEEIGRYLQTPLMTSAQLQSAMRTCHGG